MKILVYSSMLVVLSAVRSAELITAEYSSEENPGYQQENDETNSVKNHLHWETPLSDVVYVLHTRENLGKSEKIYNGDITRLEQTTFNSSKKSVFVIDCAERLGHATDLNDLVTSTALANNDLNVFVVDWTRLSSSVAYRTYVETVGKYVGQFIEQIQTRFELDGSQFVLVGFGIGAHVAAGAGSYVQKKVGHIVGLDPEKRKFGDEFEQLRASHADFVQVIHTNSVHGIYESVGHVDFFPNGGQIQPGCDGWIFHDNKCSHARSFKLFAESIDRRNNFTATLCPDHEAFKRGLCQNNQKTLMGGLLPNSAKGNFYLDTNATPPFAQG